MGLRVVLLLDGFKVPRWQYEAIDASIKHGVSIVGVLVSQNTKPVRRVMAHGGYYLLRFVCSPAAIFSKTDVRPLLDASLPIHKFDAISDGAWQRVPNSTNIILDTWKADCVIKFGMQLLRDPDLLPAKYGVLSFHHGDPSEFRGRPAVFWELRKRADHVGVMVQRLSNTLDGGEICAYGDVRIFRESLKKSLNATYSSSSSLLVLALQAVSEGRFLRNEAKGTNYRMPSNFQVFLLALQLLRRKLSRWAYGALYEKNWRVASTLSFDPGQSFALDVEGESIEWLPLPVGSSFIADPVSSSQGIFCERLSKRTHLGDIFRFDGERWFHVDTSVFGEGHFSYPTIIELGDDTYILPEMTSLGPQRIGRLVGDRVAEVIPLVGLEDQRITDPTYLFHDRLHWIFGTTPLATSDRLNCWWSKSLFGPYIAHRLNPVVIDPSRARPGGPFLKYGNVLHRVGQDNRGAYGNGITISRLDVLSPHEYSETVLGNITVARAKGPHTLCFLGDRLYFDFYHDRLTLGAGLRRLSRVLRR